MLYRYTAGPYKEFRGRIFMGGKPLEITDPGTLDAIRHQPDFEVVTAVQPTKGGDPDGEERQGQGGRRQEVLTAPPEVKRPIISLGRRK